jgi:hypothetical protein
MIDNFLNTTNISLRIVQYWNYENLPRPLFMMKQLNSYNKRTAMLHTCVIKLNYTNNGSHFASHCTLIKFIHEISIQMQQIVHVERIGGRGMRGVEFTKSFIM